MSESSSKKRHRSHTGDDTETDTMFWPAIVGIAILALLLWWAAPNPPV